MEPEMIYAIITISTSLILVVMVLLGGEADVDADVDVDADLDMGGDIDMDMDADIEADLEADVDVEAGGPGHFGLKLVLGFVIGFGLGGFLAVKYNWPLPHYLAGLAGGLCVYTLEYQLLKMLYRQQANTQVSGASLAGTKAIVTHRIAPGQIGEIRAVAPGTAQSIYLRARGVDIDKEFADGTEVTVKSVATGLARVE